MIALWNRIKNETAFAGTIVLLIIQGLWVFDVIALSDDEFGYLIMALTAVFGAGVRQSVYSKSTYRALEGELLDQP